MYLQFDAALAAFRQLLRNVFREEHFVRVSYRVVLKFVEQF